MPQSGSDVHVRPSSSRPELAARADRSDGDSRTAARLCKPRWGWGTEGPRKASRLTAMGSPVARQGALIALTAVLLAVVGVAPAQAAITHPYTGTSFGPGGVGSGSFETATGVAVQQSTGDVFVLENGNGGRVYKFDSAGAPVTFSSTKTNVIEEVSYASASEAEIAVDSSTGPDAGDIYVANNSVVKIYAASGAPLGELSGGEMCGVAVDPSGNVYVGAYPETVKRYKPVTNPVTNADETSSMAGLRSVCNVAVDSAGDVYTARYSGEVTKYDALQFGSLTATGTLVDPHGRTLAVDPVGGEVFVDEVDRIAQYDGATEPPERDGTTGGTGTGALTSSFGVAIDHSSGEVYAANGNEVEIFGAGTVVPGANTDAATEVASASATLHGTVEPAGSEITSCSFEYGTEASDLTESAPCEPAPPLTGTTPVAVTARVSGLTGGSTYYYRVVTETASESVEGENVSFETSGPQISDEAFSYVGSRGATLTSSIDAKGEATTYHVEYGPTSAYGSSSQPVSIGAGESPVPVQEHIYELEADTAYHFRFVAEGAAGTTYGPDVVLTTHTLVPAGLPDGRGYEMVTPADNEGAEPYAPEGSYREDETSISTAFPSLAADNGEAVAYAGSPTSEGNGNEGNGDGNQFLAKRNPGGGWTQTDIQPTGYRSPVYGGFSSNLSYGILESREPLTPEVSDDYAHLYTRDDSEGSYRALFTSTPPNRSTPREFGAVNAAGYAGEGSLARGFAGASTDFTHVLFAANDTLVSPAVDPGPNANDLYESFDGQLSTVNLLPDGTPAPDATFGSESTENEPDVSHVISADGSRIFWTDLGTGSLYVREDAKTTSLIAEAATYLAASVDGSKVLYTKAGDMYEDDLETGLTTDLAPGGEVLGIAGAGEDLEYIYFAAKGALANGATSGVPNLYVLHDGTTRLVATLSEEREAFLDYDYAWAPDLGARSAQATPSGQDLLFMSRKSLTGYDNVKPANGTPQFEVYLYEATSGQLTCVSCNPSGEAPRNTQPYEAAAFFPDSEHSTYQLHSISEDGNRVFFESSQPLVPQANNGKINVYEWERDGTGSCAFANGCIYLLNNGSTPTQSFLIDASANGNDVFLMTSGQLLSADKNEYNDIYDARVGVAEAAVPTQCTGTGCQGTPATPPVFATPASSTYNGVGNFPPPAKPVSKPKPKPKKKTQKCVSSKKKKGKGKKAGRQAKAKQVRCNAKKAVKSARRGKSERGGR
jgi:hypothetical protein